MATHPVATPAPAPVDDWILTAPWWHWPRQPEPPELTSPGLQKYATPDLAAQFLSDPQRRLVFDAVADRAALPPFDPVTRAPTAPAAPTDRVTKLYLPTHHRNYLVAVELHCDRPGLPSPDRRAVCQAAMVIRRRRADVPPELLADARRLQRRLARSHAQVSVLERRLAAAAGRGRVGLARATALTEQRTLAMARLGTARQALADWADTSGVTRRLEGWIPLGVDASGAVVPLPERPGRDVHPLPGLGRWQPVEETPDTLAEAGFPLYPLVPDPREAGHDAAGRTIWFGVVPTSSGDLEHLAADALASGRPDRGPRFDDFAVYEIRCVVRHHDSRCPRHDEGPDCHGALTWSAPTPGYRLAAPMDARGTSNRPVTVRMPTKDELAEAAALGTGYGGVRMQGGDYAMDPNGSSFQICSFSIPLITIVATFVLRLFLPIVVLLFGLWMLLALKFCIPPSVSVSAGLDAALDADAPSAGFEATFGAEVDAALSSAGNALAQQAGNAGLTSPDLAGGLTGRPIEDKFRILKAMVAKSLRTPADDLVYEPRVERADVGL